MIIKSDKLTDIDLNQREIEKTITITNNKYQVREDEKIYEIIDKFDIVKPDIENKIIQITRSRRRKYRHILKRQGYFILE
ncbi:MAG: hypothetical protein QNJ68_03995 [Microcoleaceae cyanobacterium MO_207.B10]|nr:hypothetical protein [Microcoleaceae cyanobacterium MO_207.B10]